jgi:hypothetical protein
MQPGYVLLRDGECCDDKIYPDLGMTAELAAWWQRNNAAGGEVISVGAITALAIPVEMLRTMFPVRGTLSQGWPGRENWADPGTPRGGPPWGPAPKPSGIRLSWPVTLAPGKTERGPRRPPKAGGDRPA